MKVALASCAIAVGVGVVVAVSSCSPDRIPGAPLTATDRGVAFRSADVSTSCGSSLGSGSGSGSVSTLPGSTGSTGSTTVGRGTSSCCSGVSLTTSSGSALGSQLSDVTPPTISLTISPTTLWPPNHKLVKVATGVTATDDCDPAPTLQITVTSNQAASGNGSGNTSPDYQVVGSGSGPYDIYVRSERDGNSNTARVYTITAVATDASGNSATAGGTVTVGHNQ